MSNLVELDDYRHHVTVWDINGNAHIIPVQCLKAIANGSLPLEALDDHEVILRGILSEWLDILVFENLP